MTYSYHIFYYPFRWDIKNDNHTLFSERIDLERIHISPTSHWERVQVQTEEKDRQFLYNEKNYYYPFVHKILYDESNNKTNLIYHFERREMKNTTNLVNYLIKVPGRDKVCVLTVDAINLNLYATGIGLLSFYLRNEQEEQQDRDTVLAINQFGRRIMPPFYAEIDSQHRIETCDYIRIEGLNSTKDYYEDFQQYNENDSWRQAAFITHLIDDLTDDITTTPIIDDRLFVVSWYQNKELSSIVKNDAKAYCDNKQDFSNFWYRFLFVDNQYETCQNDEMKCKLLINQTYLRWQKYGSLYGVSRYSLVFLSDVARPYTQHLFDTFQTIYARLVELVLVQRASMLRFSAEVTDVSSLTNQDVNTVSTRISSLYKEYIRFMNQIYFREVTAQDQGIELYNLLHNTLKLEDYVKDLDNDIEELHQYVSLNEDRFRNRQAGWLNVFAAIFLPVTIITGFFGMNNWSDIITDPTDYSLVWKILWLLFGIGFILLILQIKRKKKL